MDLSSDDGEIIRRVVDGEVEQFAVLVDRYRDHVFRVVAAHVPSGVCAEVAQEVFVQAFLGLAKLRSAESLRAWLSTLAVRRAYDYWRRQRRRRRELPLSTLSKEQLRVLALVSDESARRDFDGAEARANARALLDAVLDRLSPEDRMVLVLVHLEERSVAETASLLGWSQAKVKIRVWRARARFRDLLGGLNS